MNKKCVCCEEEIPVERLEVLPETEYCAKCSSLIHPKHQKLTLSRSIQQDEPAEEEEPESKVLDWNEKNPDVPIYSSDEEALKTCI